MLDEVKIVKDDIKPYKTWEVERILEANLNVNMDAYYAIQPKQEYFQCRKDQLVYDLDEDDHYLNLFEDGRQAWENAKLRLKKRSYERELRNE